MSNKQTNALNDKYLSFKALLEQRCKEVNKYFPRNIELLSIRHKNLVAVLRNSTFYLDNIVSYVSYMNRSYDGVDSRCRLVFKFSCLIVDGEEKDSVDIDIAVDGFPFDIANDGNPICGDFVPFSRYYKFAPVSYFLKLDVIGFAFSAAYQIPLKKLDNFFDCYFSYDSYYSSVFFDAHSDVYHSITRLDKQNPQKYCDTVFRIIDNLLSMYAGEPDKRNTVINIMTNIITNYDDTECMAYLLHRIHENAEMSEGNYDMIL